MSVLSKMSEMGMLSEMAEMNLLARAHEYKWAIALAAVGVYILRKLRTYWRLRHFKGPRGTGLFGLWHTRALLSWKSHLKYREATETYGSLARIGPNHLVTSDPELWMHMSAVRSNYSRAPWYFVAARVQAGKDTTFSQVDEGKHKRRRQQVAPGYAGKDNEALESSIDIHVAELITLIRKKYLSTDAASHPVDFGEKISFMTLDVISRIGFGQPFGSLLADRDVDGFFEAGNTGLPVNSYIIGLGISHIAHIPWVFRLLGPGEKDETGLGKLAANARKVVEQRLKKGIDATKKSDMLASFMRHGLDKEELVTEASLQVVAGADTTASTLRGTMLYLLSHPRVYAKLQREVDAVVADGLADPSPAVIPDSVVRKMPYLQAVVREGIRIHPPVTVEVPKVVPRGGETFTVDGKSVYLPGGTHISLATLSMFRRRDIFGEDVDNFRPERWLLEEDEKKLAVMNRTVDLVFGYGKYQCLGKAIAQTEIGKALFELIRNFDFSIANPEKPWKEFNYSGLYVHEDMFLLATERGGTVQ